MEKLVNEYDLPADVKLVKSNQNRADKSTVDLARCSEEEDRTSETLLCSNSEQMPLRQEKVGTVSKWASWH